MTTRPKAGPRIGKGQQKMVRAAGFEPAARGRTVEVSTGGEHAGKVCPEQSNQACFGSQGWENLAQRKPSMPAHSRQKFRSGRPKTVPPIEKGSQ